MAYPTIQFIILIIKVCDRQQKKKREKEHNSSTQTFKSHIIPTVLNKGQIKRIIVHLLHVHTYEIYRRDAIVIL
jgi:hypothetical protein